MRIIKPNRVVMGGCVLAFGASFVNTGFLLSAGTSVSHLTGDTAQIGSGLSHINNGDGLSLAKVSMASAGFIAGATISGFFLHHPTLEITRPYGRMLSALGLFLMAAHLIHTNYPLLSIGIAGADCGAQNALANRYRGVILRTTHLTGLFTDFGIYLGMKIRGHDIESWKLLIPLWITMSFLLGAVVSSYLLMSGRSDWLLLAGLGYMTGGIIWSIYKRTGVEKGSG